MAIPMVYFLFQSSKYDYEMRHNLKLNGDVTMAAPVIMQGLQGLPITVLRLAPLVWERIDDFVFI